MLVLVLILVIFSEDGSFNVVFGVVGLVLFVLVIWLIRILVFNQPNLTITGLGVGVMVGGNIVINSGGGVNVNHLHGICKANILNLHHASIVF